MIRLSRATAEPAVELVEVSGATFRVAIHDGEPGGTPLLLFNGIGASLETFGPFLDALDPARPVIRLDVPGIGGSPMPARPYRFSTLSRSIGRLLDRLEVSEVDVLGISWGGALAQQFALTERKRVRRIVLVATSTGSISVPANPFVLAHLATPRRHRDPAHMMSIAGTIYGGSLRQHQDHLKDLLPYFGRGGQKGGYALQLLAGAGWTSVPFLPLIRQPILILAGDDDPIISSLNGRIIARLSRHSELVTYHGGHIDLVANPGELVPHIERFLAEPLPASSV
ncbi:MAG: alpha/beta fold hydrolase [Antricoccus sp.]